MPTVDITMLSIKMNAGLPFYFCVFYLVWRQICLAGNGQHNRKTGGGKWTPKITNLHIFSFSLWAPRQGYIQPVCQISDEYLKKSPCES